MDKSNGRKRPRAENNSIGEEILPTSITTNNTKLSTTSTNNHTNTTVDHDNGSSSSSNTGSIKRRLIKLLENRKEGYVQKEIETALSK